ncbi:MAG: M48 family metalloprotease [Saprospiraceae bacterium]|nr:M48 family metalloprotease [Saprospiraceae bacterium]
MNIKTLLFAIISTVIISSCSRNPVTGKKEFMLMSEGQELALGKESDPAIVAQYGLYDNKALQAFITDKGKQMAAISHRPTLNYEFKILDSPIVNAFAVPGGYVYFTRGIMGHFNNEAEFAGVLGHEIGHIAAKHSAKQYSQQMLTQVLFIGGMVVSEDFRKFADVAQQGIGLLFLKFSRDHETESDKLGVDYSTKIGYDAHEMAGFFKTLKNLGGEGGSIPTFLSTHPDPGDRNSKVNKLADEAQKNLNPATLKVGRNNYLKMIDGMIYGEDPKQGYVENGIFYHPELKFQFAVPSGWKTLNSPAQVQMAPEDGKALMAFGVGEGTSLTDAKDKVIKENQLIVIESTNINVNGLPAIALLSDITPPAESGQQASEPLKVLTYLIQYNNLIYKFHGLSTKADFNSYFSNFQSTMKSFKSLTDQSKINKKPTLIKIVESKKKTTLLQLFQDNKMPAAKHKELAILNGMELNETVENGTMVKVFGGAF